MSKLGNTTGKVVRHTSPCDVGLDILEKADRLYPDMKMIVPLVNKVKNIVPMFSGDYIVDIVGVVDDVIVSVSEVTGNSDNEILYIGWESGGRLHNMKFTEGNLSKALLTGGNLVMEDSEGDEVTLHFS